MLRLITIAFSHYNEKARWILDRYRVPYVEERYLPVFHFAPVMRATWRQGGGRGDRVSTRFSTPLVVTETGERICDSSDIARWVCERSGATAEMYGDDEVTELEQRFHDKLGPHTRRAAYYYILADQRACLQLSERNVGARQSRWLRGIFPVWRGFLRNRLGIDARGFERSRSAVLRELDAVSERLSGREYLCGDRFTMADLSFACMISPAIAPTPDDGYGAYLPALDEMQPEPRAMVSEFREHPAGQFALKLFRQHRREVVERGDRRAFHEVSMT